MASEKILLIEDDESISELVSLHLTNNSYGLDQAFDLATARKKLETEKYDLILLDLMLPDGSGMEICQELRMKKDQTPIIILTAKSEEIDKVLGLEMGADDYITKPFSIREFLARIKALLRRTGESVIQEEEEIISHSNLQIDVKKRRVRLNDKVIELTKKEFELLYLLAKNPGVNYSRSRLLDVIWGYQFDGYEHTVNSHINRLRNKIELDDSKPNFIITTWGVGYKFNDELED